ncbi:bifunctional diguanylate cyclase/phosphodiesterase [Endozoicomonas arenosclerae]|uniref:bifunctional diguanylate cyclase/phosphodiesterase n=1 Tax=Endozoicomonas arenosclerae TaxID=1633495 RepID=UPI000783DB79|nr:EAL domain-containing protein [Endozoicomonas arenosclerae]
MTLIRELAAYLTILLFLLFGGSLIMSISDTRSYLQQQLESHAQDTATSLGLAIAATEAGNVATVDSMIDAIFDRGYYRVIRFTDAEGNVLVSSEHDLVLDDVPGWFVSLVSLKAPEVSTEVNRGWNLAGTLYVSSHPGYAYRSLWSKTLHSTWLFGCGLLVAVLGLNLLLKITLRPLKRLEQQANAICEKRFDVQTRLPKTRDLRRVVEAMNRMVGKLELLFNEKVILTEELRRQSVKDPLTGILNRRAFDDRLSSELISKERGESGGSLLLLQISGLDDYNRDHGRTEADRLLVDLARHLCKPIQRWQESFAGRRSGSEFAVFVPACDLEQANQVTEACFRSIASLPFFSSDEGEKSLHIGAVTHLGRIDQGELLHQADQLLRSVQHNGGNNWQVREIDIKDGQPYSQWSEGHWQESLRQVLKSQEVELFAQPVVDFSGQLIFREVFTRLRLLGELASAEAFLPMVERFDLHADFDKVVVEVLLVKMRNGDPKERFCLNLSPRSLLNREFYDWFLSTLRAVPDLCSRLILEIPERTLLLAGDQLSDIVDELLATGCRFSVDHFGIASRTLSSLHMLNLDYIKVDGSFVRGIAHNQGNRFYIRTLAMLASSRDIQLLAQDVEEEQDWLKLRDLGVQGGQGFYLGRPERL